MARLSLNILILIALLVASVVAQDPPPVKDSNPNAWKEFSSAEGGFTVFLPGTPKADVTELESNRGRLKTHFFTLEVDDLAFYISYADVQVSPKTPGEREAALDGIRDHVAARHRILNERIITLDGGIVGRELLIRREIGLIMRGMFFYAKGRLYYLIITVPPMVAFRNGEPSTNPADLTELFETTSKRFFGSFKLTK